MKRKKFLGLAFENEFLMLFPETKHAVSDTLIFIVKRYSSEHNDDTWEPIRRIPRCHATCYGIQQCLLILDEIM